MGKLDPFGSNERGIFKPFSLQGANLYHSARIPLYVALVALNGEVEVPAPIAGKRSSFKVREENSFETGGQFELPRYPRVALFHG